jgi:hypothetical protein
MIVLLDAGFSICELLIFLISKRSGGGRVTARRGNPNRAVHVILKLRSRPFYCWRKADIGIGMSKAVAATPIPFWHVLGGNVQPVPLPWHPAAQNI